MASWSTNSACFSLSAQKAADDCECVDMTSWPRESECTLPTYLEHSSQRPSLTLGPSRRLRPHRRPDPAVSNDLPGPSDSRRETKGRQLREQC
jgi:hypothetical protein